MNNPGPKPLTNSQQAAGVLRNLIFRGELAAGSNHLESELAERLKMSRTPVREAALVLEAQGLLEMRPRKGVRILEISADDMREIYEVLTELESLAAYQAASACYDARALAALATAIEAMEDALAHNDLEAWATADDQFHGELVRLGQNGRIRAIVAMMADQVRRARAITLYLREIPNKSNEDHRAVLHAIQNGEAEHARSIHRAHRERTKSMMLELLEKHWLRRI